MKSVAHSGVVTVPVGDKGPGPTTPAKALEFTISAAPGQRLTLAMMFGQSNDLFYAPGGKAITLFDSKGQPLTTDITSQLQLWDTGTEVTKSRASVQTRRHVRPPRIPGPPRRAT
jgi:hypothetical protein